MSARKINAWLERFDRVVRLERGAIFLGNGTVEFDKKKLAEDWGPTFTNFKSFHRNLSRYYFKKVGPTGVEQYQHAFYEPGRPDLLFKMKRQNKNDKASATAPSVQTFLPRTNPTQSAQNERLHMTEREFRQTYDDTSSMGESSVGVDAQVYMPIAPIDGAANYGSFPGNDDVNSWITSGTGSHGMGTCYGPPAMPSSPTTTNSDELEQQMDSLAGVDYVEMEEDLVKMFFGGTEQPPYGCDTAPAYDNGNQTYGAMDFVASTHTFAANAHESAQQQFALADIEAMFAAPLVTVN